MSNLGRTKQIHLNVSEEEKTTLKTWAESQNMTITQVLRNHIAKLKVFSDAELQALKTPNFVKQDFELEPESPRLTFHLTTTPRGFCRPCDTLRIHENGKCAACGEWVVVE
jgi:molybdenum cofactor biosynthesis enzyme MoaA